MEKSERVARQKIYRAKLKQLVFDYYGSECVCCGENEAMFLALDHIHENGSEHRKEHNYGSGTSVHIWIIKNNFPEDVFQVLCFNCNRGKHFNNGVCPHKSGSQ